MGDNGGCEKRFVIISGATKAEIFTSMGMEARCYVDKGSYMEKDVGFVLPYVDTFIGEHDPSRFEKKNPDERFVLFFDPNRAERPRYQLEGHPRLLGLASGYHFVCFYDDELVYVEGSRLEDLLVTAKVVFRRELHRDEDRYLKNMWARLNHFENYVPRSNLDLVPVSRFDREISEEKLRRAQERKEHLDFLKRARMKSAVLARERVMS